MSGNVWSRRDFLRARVPPALIGLGSAPAEAAEQGDVALAPRVARLDPGRCLAASSQICTVCVERCPEHGAIRLEGLRPQIELARCTGCGLCVAACPAPENALRLMPRARARP